MDNVAKEFQANVILGESFWYHVTFAVFPAKTTKYPLVRVALMLANLTSNKQEDGIAKLLTKTDISRLCGKAKVDNIAECDAVLLGALDIISVMQKSNQTSRVLDEDAALAPLGKLFVRIALNATDKGKLGAEGKQYTLEEIKAMFIKQISDIVGMDVEYEKWNAKHTGADGLISGNAGAQAPAKVVRNSVATLSDHSDPIWVAQQAGFEVGKNVIEKCRETRVENVFTITNIGTTVRVVQLCRHAIGDPIEANLPLDTLLSNWSVNNVLVPMRMSQGQQRSELLHVDVKRAAIFNAIMAADKLNKADASCVFWRRPDEIRTSAKISKGHLVLAPVCPLSSITTKASSVGQSLGKFEIENRKKPMEFFANPLSKPPARDGEFEWPKPAVLAENTILSVVAFWWIGTTHEKTQANMALEFVTKNGIAIPVLTNTSDLQPHTKLLRYKAKVAAEAFRDASIVTPEAAPAQKRSKKA
jgi:hypothetical protein